MALVFELGSKHCFDTIGWEFIMGVAASEKGTIAREAAIGSMCLYSPRETGIGPILVDALDDPSLRTRAISQKCLIRFAVEMHDIVPFPNVSAGQTTEGLRAWWRQYEPIIEQKRISLDFAACKTSHNNK
ncbi:MAG: hypothetical protein JNM27_21375 [Leptospirales bacterium]|nr:hypothetical protein [Leptospirales bacterium]